MNGGDQDRERLEINICLDSIDLESVFLENFYVSSEIDANYLKHIRGFQKDPIAELNEKNVIGLSLQLLYLLPLGQQEKNEVLGVGKIEALKSFSRKIIRS
jgi:hypothetical protein